MIFSYNKNNVKYARTNRNQYFMTDAEWKFWNLALKNDATGYRFLRQVMIWNYIVDFYCYKLKLCIEIDGDSHNWQVRYDEKRNQYLQSLWIKTIRYTNNQVYYQLEWVMLDIEREIKEREGEFLPLNPPPLRGTPSF